MLNISKQIYVGLDTTKITDGLNMAEIMPAGLTPAEINKVKRSASQGLSINEFDNIPLPGFTLHEVNYKSYDTNWIVIDPRGYMTRISSRNLNNILKITGITEGLIQQKCIWVREDNGTKMSLMPISSVDYATAIKNTELIENKVDMEDVEIGDTVLLQNGMSGTYMGKLSLYGSLVDGYGKTELKPQISLKRQIVEVEPSKFYHQLDVKILKIISKGIPQTLEESAKYINDKIALGAVFSNYEFFQTLKFNARGIVGLASTSNTKAVKLSYHEITRREADALYYECMTILDSGALIVEDEDKKRYVINYTYATSNNIFTLDNCHLCEIDPTFYSDMVLLKNKRDRGSRNVDKLIKFYKIVKHVKNDSYV